MTRRGCMMIVTSAIAQVAPSLAHAQISSQSHAAEIKALTNAMSEIDALHGALPSMYDVYSDDPCAGDWDFSKADGVVALKTTIFRYRGQSFAHLSGPNFGYMNLPVMRLDPHSIKVGSTINGLVLRCVADRAVAEMVPSPPSRPFTLQGSRGQANRPVTSATKSPPIAPQATVRVNDGNVVYVDARGTRRRLTDGGYYSEPVLSPDGRTVAFMHPDGKPTEEGESGFTSLWVADTATGKQHRLLASRPDDEPKRNLASFGNPHFSLDGGFVYVDVEAWATSSAVHQINVTTGAERFVVAGTTKAIIRNGPNRGYLVVMQHRYRKPPATGSYSPLFVVRPDGAEVMLVPGSDADDYDVDKLLAAWLRENGWAAW